MRPSNPPRPPLIVPQEGRNRPTIAFSTVLLPQPLPPMIAKIEPRRTEKLSSRWMTRPPNATVRFLTSIGCSALCWEIMASDSKRMAAHGKYRIQDDYPNNADHDCGCGGVAHIGGAASGSQAR